MFHGVNVTRLVGLAQPQRWGRGEAEGTLVRVSVPPQPCPGTPTQHLAEPLAHRDGSSMDHPAPLSLSGLAVAGEKAWLNTCKFPQNNPPEPIGWQKGRERQHLRQAEPAMPRPGRPPALLGRDGFPGSAAPRGAQGTLAPSAAVLCVPEITGHGGQQSTARRSCVNMLPFTHSPRRLRREGHGGRGSERRSPRAGESSWLSPSVLLSPSFPRWQGPAAGRPQFAPIQRW